MLTAVRLMASGLIELVVGHGPVVRLQAARPRRRRRPTSSLAIKRLGLLLREPAHERREGPAWTTFSACSSVRPAVGVRGYARPAASFGADRLRARPHGVLQPLERRRGRVEVAVGVVRAAGAEDDVRADQAGEEHHFGGQEEPHGDLAGSDGGMAHVSRGPGPRRARRARSRSSCGWRLPSW